jgi:dihydrofolate reductase
MRRLIFSMTLSLDGYVAGPGGDIGWSAPDEELHRFHNRQNAEIGAQVCGRGLYETMLYWEDPAVAGPSMPQYAREFAAIWRALPKYVFSRTLDSVQGSWTLMAGDLREQVQRLKTQDGPPIGAGGANLAGQLMQLGLVDEYRLFITPILLGGGTRCFPDLQLRRELELVETKTFSGAQTVYLRYATT